MADDPKVDARTIAPYREVIDHALIEWQAHLLAPPSFPMLESELGSLAALIVRKLEQAELIDPEEGWP